MKRHEGISWQARQAAGRCVVLLTVTLCAAVGAVRATHSDAPWGALALAVALICFPAAVRYGLLGHDCIRRAFELFHRKGAKAAKGREARNGGGKG